MKLQIVKTTPVMQVMKILGIVALVSIVVCFLAMRYAPIHWTLESFSFASGQKCYIFAEPKLGIFLCDGGDDDVFEGNNGYHRGKMNVNSIFGFGDRWEQDGFVALPVRYGYDRTGAPTKTMYVLTIDDKYSMTVSERGTLLTLLSGREFMLDGKTPLWLCCKPDGTVVPLKEQPKGFLEFMKSPPPDSSIIKAIQSGEAFVK